MTTSNARCRARSAGTADSDPALSMADAHTPENPIGCGFCDEEENTTERRNVCDLFVDIGRVVQEEPCQREPCIDNTTSTKAAPFLMLARNQHNSKTNSKHEIVPHHNVRNIPDRRAQQPARVRQNTAQTVLLVA
jgi:hypothetical protein